MKFIEAILIVLLSTAVLLIVAQIIWRYVLRSPLGWTEQVARAEFIWMIMLGIPVMFNRYITMSFDLILSKIKGGANTTLRILINLIGLSFCVFYFIASLTLCINTGSRMVTGMPIPLNALYSAQPTCAALLFIVLVKQTVEILQKAVRKEDKPQC
jgi:TRAP-type C4-dicarboxylate transport system permease small subunit